MSPRVGLAIVAVFLTACGRRGFDLLIDGSHTGTGTDGGGADIMTALSSDAALDTISQHAYLKASNTDPGDAFGTSTALSADGTTLAVAAVGEASGIAGIESNNSAPNAGAVYIFVRAGDTWSQQAYVKAANADPGDVFGFAIALSSDGSTLAVGARAEDSTATGVNGNAANNTLMDSGAAYIFVRTGVTWAQQAYIKGLSTDLGDVFGSTVALSGDGATLAVGAYQEDSAATGIDGNAANNSASGAGAVYVFTRTGVVWTQQAYVKASNTDAFDLFGYAVALSGDGSTLAIGALGEQSAASGVDGNQLDNSLTQAGAVYVFQRAGTTWSQQAYIKASNTGGFDGFGASVAVSSDASTLVIAATQEASAATGVNGDQTDNSRTTGATYVFVRAGNTWVQEAYLKPSHIGVGGMGDLFGFRLGLSGDGSTLAIGASNEASAATGIDGDPADASAPSAGAVYMFTRDGATWAQEAYVKASNTNLNDAFCEVALSSDASTLAVGAPSEASTATGIGGNQGDNSAGNAGAVYIFR